MKKQLINFALILLGVFALSWVWEFMLEPNLPFSETPISEESFNERWEYVLTATIFCFLALIFPLLRTLKLEREREDTLYSKQQAIEELDETNAKLNREISERRQAEEELNLIINLVPGMICTAGSDGYFKTVNPSLVRTLGFSRQELLSRPLLDFVHPEDRHPVKREHQEKISGRRIRSFENRYLCRDGSYRLLKWYTTSAVDGVLYAVASDITRQRQAEAELMHSKEVNETILNSIHDAVCLIDTDDFRIIEANRTFLEEYQLSREDVIGRSCHEVTHNRQEPCCPPNDVCPLKKTVQEGLVVHEEHLHFHSDGSEAIVEIFTSPIRDANGKVRQVVHVSRDITDRKLVEKERENMISRLQSALDEIKTLQGIIPICMYCKKIKDDKGTWDQLEQYLEEHSDADFSHGICPDCYEKQLEEVKKIKKV